MGATVISADGHFEWDREKDAVNKQKHGFYFSRSIMRTLNTLSEERIAEILAFQDSDFSDCPLQTQEELAEFYPKYPENLKQGRDYVQVNIAPDIYEWFRGKDTDVQASVNRMLPQYVHKYNA